MESAKQVVLLVASLVLMLAVALSLNYFDVYRVTFGVDEFAKPVAITIFLAMLLSIFVATSYPCRSIFIRWLSAVIFLMLLSAWSPTFSALPGYMPFILGGMILLIMVVNERIRRNKNRRPEE